MALAIISINKQVTKFQPADKIGTQSQNNIQLNNTPASGSLWFDFR